jgi:hypothetical protein
LCKSLPVIPHIGVPSKLDVSLNYGHTWKLVPFTSTEF